MPKGQAPQARADEQESCPQRSAPGTSFTLQGRHFCYNSEAQAAVGNAPEAGQPEVEALVREPMGREGSLESDWNLRRIGALLAKSEAMDDEYAVARRKIFNPLPTTQDKAAKAPVTGLRTSGLVTRTVVALDHLGDASALRTEGLIRLEGPIITKNENRPCRACTWIE